MAVAPELVGGTTNSNETVQLGSEDGQGWGGKKERGESAEEDGRLGPSRGGRQGSEEPAGRCSAGTWGQEANVEVQTPVIKSG